MSDAAGEFSRIIIGLEPCAPDPAMLRFAAAFARLLRLDLFGLFAQDPRLAGLGGHSLLREFRTLEGRWRDIPGSSLSHDLERTAALAKQALDEAGKSAGVPSRFEITNATILEAIATISSATDIVMAAETRTLAGRPSQPLAEVVGAALATQAAVLVVPNLIARSRGPVLAIAKTANNSHVATSAAAIATAADERVEVVALSSLTLPPPWGLPERMGERVIVMPREIGDRATALEVASQRRVPVLVLSPVSRRNERSRMK